jgi:hypothetical protein
VFARQAATGVGTTRQFEIMPERWLLACCSAW